MVVVIVLLGFVLGIIGAIITGRPDAVEAALAPRSRRRHCPTTDWDAAHATSSASSRTSSGSRRSTRRTRPAPSSTPPTASPRSCARSASSPRSSSRSPAAARCSRGCAATAPAATRSCCSRTSTSSRPTPPTAGPTARSTRDVADGYVWGRGAVDMKGMVALEIGWSGCSPPAPAPPASILRATRSRASGATSCSPARPTRRPAAGGRGLGRRQPAGAAARRGRRQRGRRRVGARSAGAGSTRSRSRRRATRCTASSSTARGATARCRARTTRSSWPPRPCGRLATPGEPRITPVIQPLLDEVARRPAPDQAALARGDRAATTRAAARPRSAGCATRCTPGRSVP